MSESLTPNPTAARSFCSRGPQEVGHLFAGPGAWICDGCVTTCYNILQRLPDKEGGSSAVPMDATMASIAQVQQVALRGGKEQATAGLLALWDQIGAGGPPLHRVTVAHYLADLQDDPADELLWNERALAAAHEAQSKEEADAVRPLLASLNFNTAQTLYRLGRRPGALRHLSKAEQSQAHLPHDGYGEMLRTEIAALHEQIDPQPELPL